MPLILTQTCTGISKCRQSPVAFVILGVENVMYLKSKETLVAGPVHLQAKYCVVLLSMLSILKQM
jgi:hypothetical protein